MTGLMSELGSISMKLNIPIKQGQKKIIFISVTYGYFLPLLKSRFVLLKHISECRSWQRIRKEVESLPVNFVQECAMLL